MSDSEPDKDPMDAILRPLFEMTQKMHLLAVQEQMHNSVELLVRGSNIGSGCMLAAQIAKKADAEGEPVNGMVVFICGKHVVRQDMDALAEYLKGLSQDMHPGQSVFVAPRDKEDDDD